MLDGKNMPNLSIGENIALKVLHKLVLVEYLRMNGSVRRQAGVSKSA